LNRPSLLVLVRHAESDRNKAKKGLTYFADDAARRCVKGVPDYKIELTDDGLKQALITGTGLRAEYGTFDYAYHSGYARTAQTLNGILEAYTPEERNNIKVRENMFIRERDSGYAYDMTEEEARAAFPWLKEYWQTMGGFMGRPPGGESLADVCQRVYLFLNMLFRDRAGQKVLVVTHGGTLRAFRKLLEHWSYDRATEAFKTDPPLNCSVISYSCDQSSGRLVPWNVYSKVYY
jgi:broad specificity phosphatase PhoE